MILDDWLKKSRVNSFDQTSTSCNRANNTTCISFVNFTTRLSVIKMGSTDSRYNQVNYINHYFLCKEKTCSTCDTLWLFYIDIAIEQAATSLHRKNYTSHYFSCKESGCLACDSLWNIYIEGAPTNVRTINEIFHKRKWP